MRRVLVVAGALVALLVVAQLVLPSLAARHIADDLKRHGTAVHVDVAAFPAIKLLWHRADRVTVTVDDYRPGPPKSGVSLADELASTKDTGKLDVRVRVLRDRLLRMFDIHVTKSGSTLTGHVRIQRSDLASALPPQLHLTGREVGPNAISVAGVTSVFGRRINAQALILVDDQGRIVLKPQGFPLSSLVTVPLFSDHRVAVQTIVARPLPDGFAVTARAQLR
ncbi:MAG: hypothetical protein ACXVFT_19285 [Solirubrobacteraceae bacterium]